MSPSDRRKTVLIDLNIVEKQELFDPIVRAAKRRGGFLMITEAHLAELLKDEPTWKTALTRHFAALRPVRDLIVVPRQTHELFLSELLDARPARKIIDDESTGRIRSAIDGMQRPSDVGRYLSREVSSIRNETVATMLDASAARSRALFASEHLRKAITIGNKDKIRRGDKELLCVIGANEAVHALCRFREVARVNLAQFCQFVSHSVFFKVLATELLADLQSSVDGLTEISEAKASNIHLDQYVIFMGAAVCGIDFGQSRKRALLAPDTHAAFC